MNYVGYVPYSLDNGHKYVDMFIQELNGLDTTSVEFLFDTGATITTIKKITLCECLGISVQELLKQSLPGYNLKTALNSNPENTDEDLESDEDNKKGNSRYISVPKIILMERDFINKRLYFHPDEGLDYSNLLGEDMLSYFDIMLSGSEWRAKFYRIDKPKYNLLEASEKTIGSLMPPNP